MSVVDVSLLIVFKPFHQITFLAYPVRCQLLKRGCDSVKQLPVDRNRLVVIPFPVISSEAVHIRFPVISSEAGHIQFPVISSEAAGRVERSRSLKSVGEQLAHQLIVHSRAHAYAYFLPVHDEFILRRRCRSSHKISCYRICDHSRKEEFRCALKGRVDPFQILDVSGVRIMLPKMGAQPCAACVGRTP